MNGFLFRFFCFFTEDQPHIYLSAAEKKKDFFIFQYALIFSPTIAVNSKYNSDFSPPLSIFHKYCKIIPYFWHFIFLYINSCLKTFHVFAFHLTPETNMVRTRIWYKFCNIFPYFWWKLTPYSAPYLTFIKKLRISFFLSNNSGLATLTPVKHPEYMK